MWKKVTALCALALLVSASAVAQQAATKRALTHNDYDSWRAIQGQSLSRDGKFVAYALVPQDGDGEVVVRNLTTGVEWRHARGAQPVNPPQRTPEAEPTFGPPQFGGRPVFTADNRFLVFQIQPAKAETEKAKKEKKKPEEMPKSAMGILDLTSGQVTRVERVKSFQVPEDGAGFIAYLLEPKAEEKKTDEKNPDAAPAARTRAAETRRRNTEATSCCAT
jgi:hypothetical protein